jgi:hypothetical protein
VKKNALSSCRPTGKLEPNPAALASGRLELEALEYGARPGEIILLYQDETVRWRFALPRRGWWRRRPRDRRPTRPLSPSPLNAPERLKRQAWHQHRRWSRIPSGVLLEVIGAVPYGPARVFSKIGPHCDAHAFRQYLHPVMRIVGATQTQGGMGVARSGIHRARTWASTLAPSQDKCEWHCLPAHSAHHLHPIEGFWRRMKEGMGAGRCFESVHQLYQRPRHVLRAHQERPIYEVSWELIPPQTSRVLL